ncbi:S8 family peptidase [Cohnella lupini]|uniref:Type VII secretion-associated serine protease mycosin n=1 Tax=Cohnella lupini TaxID=1294267 RepID=A0A3D9IVY0_9BACL|nr:S8 family peptidase [Cohnella lupini]RED65737.1 type VII secretion-associated serine protease mycosin [Cohnella lupini]
MRRNKLLVFLFIVAVVLFAFPFLLPTAKPDNGAAPSHPRTMRSASEKANEKTYKLQTVKRDMEATDRLSRSQVTRDIRKFLREGPVADFGLQSQALLKTHPEILYAEWANEEKNKTYGKPKPELMQEANSYLDKARTAIRQGNSYASPTFSHDGFSYFVLSQPAPNGKHGVAALISTEVIQAVERHQRRNLRLVPFPPEGRYRTESVVPGSNEETTVHDGEDNGNASHYSVDEIVVKFRAPLTDRQLLQLRQELSLTIVRHTGRTYVFRSKKHETKALKKYFEDKWNPEFVEPHYLYLTNSRIESADNETIVPNDTLYSEYQWNLPEIATANGWAITKGSKEVVVAVLDTGVQMDHPDLKGRLVKGTNIVDPSQPPDDDVGHGTHVAGIIAAEINNNEGVAGMTWFTKIMPVKVLDSSGAGSTYSVAEGIIWAADHGAQVINMSLGNYAEADFLHDALKYAYDRGIVIVAASGNDSTDRPGYPAAYDEVIGVSATDPDESRAEYSNFGDYIDVAAPGTSIPSTYPGSRYAALSGTSMASPHVAALASLVRSANPDLSNAEVMDLLRSTAKDLGPSGKDNDYGYGQIDVKSALQSASGTDTSLQLYPLQVRRQLERLNTKE